MLENGAMTPLLRMNLGIKTVGSCFWWSFKLKSFSWGLKQTPTGVRAKINAFMFRLFDVTLIPLLALNIHATWFSVSD